MNLPWPIFAFIKISVVTVAYALYLCNAWSVESMPNLGANAQAIIKEVVIVPSVKKAGMVPDLQGQVYADLSKAQAFDLYRPKGKSSNTITPILVYVHGGGFAVGDKAGNASEAIIKGFLAAGYSVISVNYRLSAEAKFPAAVQDVFAAVAYIKKYANELKVDPERLVIYGESAGANLAALVGTAYNEPLFRELLEKQIDKNISIRPSAVIVQYPTIDFGLTDTMLQAERCNQALITHNEPDGLESVYLGSALPEVPNLIVKANPAIYPSLLKPPTLAVIISAHENQPNRPRETSIREASSYRAR